MVIARGESPERPALEEARFRRLRSLLETILPHNRFYARKFADAGVSDSDLRAPEDLARLPFTTKKELSEDQFAHPLYGTALTYPLERYCRLHQTSGTMGRPLRWLDTPESWQWMLSCWEQMFRVAGVRQGDRLFFPFSFGPFLGFWTAFEAAWRLGYFCLPGGGMSTEARLRFLLDNAATVVLCTPTYAQHLAEVAEREGIDLASSPVRALIVAGEPGGSIPATRARIERAWGARLFDHNGMTETGPMGIECPESPGGLHLLETEYWPEVLDPRTGRPVAPGELGELVVTNLGRTGSPLIRYRTGDLVRVDPRSCPCGLSFVRLEGGILGRCDDMIHVRGNNVYPGTLEAVIRRFSEVAEYRVTVERDGALAAVRIEIEPTRAELGPPVVEAIGRAFREELLFRAEIRPVAPGTLPRFEMKAKRVHYHGH